MAAWSETSQWHEMFCHDPQVMGWNLSQAERINFSPSVGLKPDMVRR